MFDNSFFLMLYKYFFQYAKYVSDYMYFIFYRIDKH